MGPSERRSTQARRVERERAVCERARAATVRPREWNWVVLEVGEGEGEVVSWTEKERGKRGVEEEEVGVGGWEGRVVEEDELAGGSEGIASE